MAVAIIGIIHGLVVLILLPCAYYFASMTRHR